MSETKYPLSIPIEYIYSAVSYTVQVINIELNTSATICASLYKADGSIIENKIYTLTGAEYDLWLSDDYIIEYVRIQLEKEALLSRRVD